MQIEIAPCTEFPVIANPSRTINLHITKIKITIHLLLYVVFYTTAIYFLFEVLVTASQH